MNRLHKIVTQKRNTGDKILSIYITAGYPQLQSTPELVLMLEEAGADFVEIGIPFSDPIADGPTIQQASYQALQNGMTLSRALHQISQLRNRTGLPIVLMSYINPLLRYGMPDLVRDAVAAGVDGFIIPDLLAEDYLNFQPAFSGNHFGLNFLVSPNTQPRRIAQVAALTDAFLYCVSVTGVTGARNGISAELIEFLAGVEEVTRHPRLVGFGIANPGDAVEISRHCEGIIIGSAVIQRLAQHNGRAGLQAAAQFVSEIKANITR